MGDVLAAIHINKFNLSMDISRIALGRLPYNFLKVIQGSPEIIKGLMVTDSFSHKFHYYFRSFLCLAPSTNTF